MSSGGGKTFLPVSSSLLRKRFRPRNSLLVTSSFSTPSQLSCSVSISSLRSSFCSASSFATHASLSNLIGFVSSAVAPLAGRSGFVEDGAALDLGAPKKEVMDLSALGFLAASAARSTALRLSDMSAVMSQCVQCTWSLHSIDEDDARVGETRLGDNVGDAARVRGRLGQLSLVRGDNPLHSARPRAWTGVQ